MTVKDKIIKFYSFLDSYDFIEPKIYYITNEIINPLIEISDDSFKEKLKFESWALEFSFENGKAIPISQVTYKNGDIWSYPSFDDFTNETYIYYKKRIETPNLYLQARYYHILWLSPEKTEPYLENAINAYLQLVNNEINRKVKNSDNIYSFISNAIFLSLQNKKFKNIFQHGIDLLQYEDIEIYYKIKIIEIIISEKLKAEIKYLSVFDEILKKAYDIYLTGNDFNTLNTVCSLGEKIYQKLDKSGNKYWQNQHGNALVKIAEEKYSDNFYSLELFRQAMNVFASIGNKEKLNEVGLKTQQFKRSVKFHNVNFSIDSDLKEFFNSYMESSTKAVENLDTRNTFKFLVNNNFLFPNNEQIDNSNSLGLSEIHQIINFDENTNIRKPKITELDKKRLAYFKISFESIGANLISNIFLKSLSNRKISYITIIEYLKNNSWLGENLGYTDKNSTKLYTWIDLLTPSLFEFFFQYDCVLKSNSKKMNYVLPLDSLVLKFEGILRDLALRLGINNIRLKNGNQQMMLLEEILNNSDFRKSISEYDWLLFAFVFTNRGLNLRNKVAHCFFKFDDYQFKYVIYVIFCILRLTKYEISK